MSQLTTCPYCGVGCGVRVNSTEGVIHGVSGDKEHPANFGKLCVKGSTLHETFGNQQRLLKPSVEGVETDWDSALNEVAERLKRTIEEHGPDSVAFYLSGQLLTEDYYVANKLIKGFMGTANVDTNSRLCMASAVVGYKRAFGSDTVPCSYEDLDEANLLVLVGSNAAWNHPILYQRMKAAKKANPNLKVVVVDPRRTATCELADLHLAIKPGSDSTLFSGLLAALVNQSAIDSDFIEQHTEGFEESMKAVATLTEEKVAEACQITLEDLRTFFRWFVETEKTVTFYSQGVNQSFSGVDNSNAIINCHLATGRIGKAGMGPFSITGQPNAMGGREVGGLANQLAAHMDFATPGATDRVARFWGATQMAEQNGLKAIDMFEAVAEGKIKAIWVIATNPVVSLPASLQVEAALAKCPLVIVSDCVSQTDTLNLATIKLPATGWGEKDGTVTNSDRRISRQRGLLTPPGEAKHDWWIISEVAKRMGFVEQFDYQNPRDIFVEHAALSGFENNGQRDFDISLLADLSLQQYNDLKPIQWPVTEQAPEGTVRMFTDKRFFTPSGRARFIPITPQLPKQQPTDQHPFILNTGRLRDQWHTMTRTGRASRLFQHRSEPYVAVHPDDAKAAGLGEGMLASIGNQQSKLVLRVREEQEQRRGELFIPIHWSRQFASSARVSELIRPIGDPISGQPESKHGAVNLTAYPTAWQGWLMVRGQSCVSALPDFWSYRPLENGGLYFLADQTVPEDWHQWCCEHLSAPEISLEDKQQNHYRAAGFSTDQQLQWVLLILPYKQFPNSRWMEEIFNQTEISPQDQRYLLTATGCDAEDPGEMICSCFQVASKAIEAAIAEGCTTSASLGERLQCGTNCGSCVPELEALIKKG